MSKILKAIKKVKLKASINEASTFAEANKEFLKLHENITDLDDYRFNPDFILSACNIVENLYTPKTMKTNKKTLVINMLNYCLTNKSLAAYNEQGLKTLTGIIESLHSSKRIKKSTFIKEVYKTVKGVVKTFLA